MHHALNVTACKIVGFEIVAVHVLEPGFVGLDKSAHYHARRHLAYTHQHQLQKRNSHAADPRRNPQEKRAVVEEHYQKYYRQNNNQNNSQMHIRKN